MKRRRFQFSLRAAMVAMVIAAVGIGVYVRWPYYLAGRALDRAHGDKTCGIKDSASPSAVRCCENNINACLAALYAREKAGFMNFRVLSASPFVQALTIIDLASSKTFLQI